MAIQCQIKVESMNAFYTIKSMCYNSYKAFLKKDKRDLTEKLPARLTLTKMGLQWEGNSSYNSLIQELGAAIEYRITNDLYERQY